jgi:hypothetical protein
VKIRVGMHAKSDSPRSAEKPFLTHLPGMHCRLAGQRIDLGRWAQKRGRLGTWQNRRKDAQEASALIGGLRPGVCMETITFVAIQFLLGRIAILCFLTKVGCFKGGEKHQLAGTGPFPFASTNGEKARDFQRGSHSILSTRRREVSEEREEELIDQMRFNAAGDSFRLVAL